MSAYTHAPDVITTDLGDELILLDPRNGEVFGLNACGRRVWLGLGRKSVAQIAEHLSSEFAVTLERARADTDSLLAALADARLVVHGDAAR